VSAPAGARILAILRCARDGVEVPGRWRDNAAALLRSGAIGVTARAGIYKLHNEGRALAEQLEAQGIAPASMHDAPPRIGSARQMKGERFGRLLVLERAPANGSGAAMWRCRCDCGQIVVRVGTNLRSAHTQSCGCLSAEKRKARTA
jgi:hypothetical protein